MEDEEIMKRGSSSFLFRSFCFVSVRKGIGTHK